MIEIISNLHFSAIYVCVLRTVISKNSVNFKQATVISRLKYMSHVLKFCVTYYLLLIVTALSCISFRYEGNSKINLRLTS